MNKIRCVLWPVLVLMGLTLVASVSAGEARLLAPEEAAAIGGMGPVPPDFECQVQALHPYFCTNLSVACGAGPYPDPQFGDCYVCKGDPAGRRYCKEVPSGHCTPNVQLVYCPKHLGKCLFDETFGVYRCRDVQENPSGNCNTSTQHLCYIP